MVGIEVFWAAFEVWIAQPNPDYERESVFVCLCPGGSGWIGDGTGAMLLEFDTFDEAVARMMGRQ